jgi:predicted  nucleic acid-binding Zn-ribbon protein
MNTEYRVIGTWGAQRYETVIGTYDDLYAAETRVDTWQDDPTYKYSTFLEVRIEKHTSKIVSVARDQTSSPTPDYERTGVRDTFQPFDDLQEQVRNLEDRHVGLRHELGTDIDHVYEHITELREQVESAQAQTRNLEHIFENFECEVRHEVAGLRREIESLRHDLRVLKGASE